MDERNGSSHVRTHGAIDQLNLPQKNIAEKLQVY